MDESTLAARLREPHGLLQELIVEIDVRSHTPTLTHYTFYSVSRGRDVPASPPGRDLATHTSAADRAEWRQTGDSYLCRVAQRMDMQARRRPVGRSTDCKMNVDSKAYLAD